MNHSVIERDSVIDRYLMSQLSGQEAVRFEEHLVGCAQCLEQVEMAEDFQRSFRAAAADEIARTAVRASLLGWLRRRTAGPIALALLGASAFGYLLWRTQTLSGDLERLHLARAEEASVEDQGVEDAVASLETQLRQAETAMAAQRGELEEQLGRQRGLVDDIAARLRSLTAPQINTALITLAAARSSGDDGAAPVNQLTRPQSPGWVVLAMELALVEHETYGVELEDGDGRILWQQDGLRPDALDTLTVSLHSSFLSPGDYVLELSGIASGRRAAVGRYRFRVL